jgi:UDP-glucose 4-epimerase
MTDQRAFIVGGAGFIGSRLARDLIAQGREVVVFDRLSTGRKDLLPNGTALVQGDILDQAALLDAMRQSRPGVVFHLAALHFIPYCNAHPQETLRVNVEGTENVLRACAEIPPDRVVFASSAAVYGVSDQAYSEDASLEPIDIYGVSKAAAEMLVERFHRESDIPCTTVRLFNVYGPNDTVAHLMPELVAQAKRGGQVELGNLEPRRDYVHVEDVSQAFQLVSQVDGEFGLFNVGTGVEYSVLELVETLSSITGARLNVQSVESRRRSAERMHLRSDPARLIAKTGWRPRREMREALTEMLNGLS